MRDVPVTADADRTGCPLPAGVEPLATTGGELEAPAAERLAAVAKALSDPTRLRLLSFIAAAGGGCCRPGGDTAPEGVCVCEVQSRFGLAQSKASYHLKVLREAGLVRERQRGKWSFYAVEDDAVRALLADLAAGLRASPPG